VDDDGSYGDVAGFEGALGGSESFFHPEFVVGCRLVGRHGGCAFAF
jgi:hypothetical protein